jgi:hypothetical protein
VLPTTANVPQPAPLKVQVTSVFVAWLTVAVRVTAPPPADIVVEEPLCLMDTLVPLLPQPVTMDNNKQARIPLTTFNCDLKLASKPALFAA